MNIKIIAGSTRESRFSDKAVLWIAGETKKREGVEVEILDLRDYDMPFFNEPISPAFKKEPYKNEAVARFTKKIGEGDAFIIVTPEYNHGTSGVLKNALDWVYPEWNNKPVAFVSYGGVGGARAVEHLRGIAIELQMAPIRNAVHIPKHWNLLDENGKLKAGALEPFNGSATALLDQLLWWAEALKSAREGIYQCEECGLKYSDKEIAKKCRAWCAEHKSCNLDIIKYSVKDSADNPQN